MTTVKIDSGHTATAIAKAIKPAISTDKTKRHLLMVEIRQDGERIRIAATDSYRMHLVYVTGAGEIAEPVTLDGMELVKALTTAGKDAKAAPVHIFINDDRQGNATVDGATVSIHVPGWASDFPNVAPILAVKAPTEVGALFNGDYLSDMATAAQQIADVGLTKRMSPLGVKLEAISTNRPMRVSSVSVSGDVSFLGIVMPVRA
jgi:DNA polymerase III sliding clamp (beta) subunit (PCNA family)